MDLHSDLVQFLIIWVIFSCDDGLARFSDDNATCIVFSWENYWRNLGESCSRFVPRSILLILKISYLSSIDLRSIDFVSFGRISMGRC